MPRLATALLTCVALLAGAAPAALGQAGVSYQVPGDNPFVGLAGAAPEVYAYGLRNPYRFSFDRQTGDLLIGDVGGDQREEIDWVSSAGARGANFGWACREGKVAGPRADECPVPGAIEPLFDYPTDHPDAVTGGFVVRDPALTGLSGRYLYADYYTGVIRSLALDLDDPDDRSTDATVGTLASFGEDAAGRLYAVSNLGDQVVRLVAGPSSGTLATQALTGPFDGPVAIGTHPGNAERLFVAELAGRLRLVVDGAVRPTPFLDVAPFGLSTGGERGLLSVAAAPDYATSGKVYVYYTDSGGDIRIDEFTRSALAPEQADPATRRNVLTIEHSQHGNHNGGQLHFGADGCLWVTTGDGGGQDNQENNAQNLGTLLGKVLRIDPDPAGPVCAPSAQQPTGGSGGDGTDGMAPGLRARAKRRQRVLRLGGAVVYVRCSERCSVAAGGRLRIGRRVLRMRRVVRAAHTGTRSRIKVRLTKRGRRALRRALRQGRRPSVRLRVRARDGAGNASPLARRKVGVRR